MSIDVDNCDCFCDLLFEWSNLLSISLIEEGNSNYKAIVGNHLDADIYFTFKDLNMNPNKTAQKLLNQGPYFSLSFLWLFIYLFILLFWFIKFQVVWFNMVLFLISFVINKNLFIKFIFKIIFLVLFGLNWIVGSEWC